MRIAQHSITLTPATRVPAQSFGAQTGKTTSGQTTRAVNPFAALVTGRLPVVNSGEAVAAGTPPAPAPARTTPTVNPLAGLVACTPPVNAASRTAPAAATASLATATPAAAAASTPSSTPAAPPAQPGIGALITAMQDGTFQPALIPTAEIQGTYNNGNSAYATDQTAQQLATLLGGTVVQKIPFPTTNWATEAKANFIQLPSGQTVNAADLAGYARYSNYPVLTLAQDLTQEINQGGAISQYYDQMVAYLGGAGSYPTQTPTFQPDVIGPTIAGMAYPPGTLAADGSLINPGAPSVLGT